ncbi:MAG TPA: trigger factor [Candidatus Sulfotelmatobacter sp.]|nr:trigger factor [Candidatus Sulfotelmatobacter sp.]
MKILSQKREGNKVFLEIEEDQSRFQKSLAEALTKAGKEIRLPGFRPGKAPKQLIEQSIDPEYLQQRAAQDLVADLYPEVISAAGLEPVDYPSIEISQLAKDKPFVFKLTVEVYPEVKLGKYKGLKLEKKTAAVSEEELLKVLGNMQQRLSMTAPDGLPAGRQGQKEQLPLDDEFAKKVSSFGTLAELKAEINKALLEEKKAAADADLKDQAIAAAADGTKVEIPAALIEREIEIMLDELRTNLSRSGLTLEDYLKGAQREEQALREEMKKPAEARVKGKIVLQAVAAAEKLAVTPDEFQAEVKTMAGSSGQEPGKLEAGLGEGGKKYIEDYLLKAKALNFLVENASIKPLDIARGKEEKS